MMRKSCSLLLLLVSTLLPGIAAAQDTLQQDSARNKYLPTGIRIGTDVIHLVKSQTQDNFNGWELVGEVDFDRYSLAVEHGVWGRDLVADSAAYANNGRFWRIGIDVNFLQNDPDRNVFFLGARYGRSVFSEAMSIDRFDPIWGQHADNFYNSDTHARWIELTAGLRVKIWKIFWLGYTGRFKFALSTTGVEDMLPYDIPGYGITNKETTWGFNYYLMVRIPLRKAPPVPSKKK